MIPIRTILHPTDYSPSSDAAFAFACSLAREYFSEILLLHIVESEFVMPMEGVLAPFPTDDLDPARQRLDRLFPLDQHVKVRREIAVGDAVEEIVRTAAAAEVDMIVMGTHGRTGLSRLLLGSVAEGVLRRVACPVLFVKQPATQPEPSFHTARAK